MTKFFQRRCRHCDDPEWKHHDFEPMPGHCQCHYMEWGDDIPDPCSEFVPPPAVVGPRRHCVRCEHDEKCHAAYWLAEESKA